MTGQPVSLDSYLDSVRNLDRAVFLVRSPAFLLLMQTPGEAEVDQIGTASEAAPQGTYGFVLAPVCKRPGANSFPGMITLGRTPNNDIWLTNPGVSKFHAYFVLQGHTVCIVDANSSQGTFYGEHRLTANSRVPLHSGATLAFGNLRGTLLTAEDFYDLRVGTL